MASAKQKKACTLVFDGPFDVVDWTELDGLVPRVEKEGIEHVLWMEGVFIHHEAKEMIWE